MPTFPTLLSPSPGGSAIVVSAQVVANAGDAPGPTNRSQSAIPTLPYHTRNLHTYSLVSLG